MTNEQSFDLDDGAPGKPAGAKPAGQPTPVDHLRAKPAEARRGLRRPSERTRPSPRRPAGPSASPKEAGDLFVLFRPGFLLFLGAVVLGMLWGGGFFAQSLDAAGKWPWQLFQAEDGSFALRWSADHVSTLIGTFFVVFFLIASFSPGRVGRGAAVLTIAALGFVMRPPVAADQALYLGTVFLALGAAAVIAREGLRGGTGGKGFLFILVVLLAASLFFPLPASGTDYDGQALRTWNLLTADGTSLVDTLLLPSVFLVLLEVVVLVVALLAWLGLGGGWAVWVAGIALVLAVLGPLGIATKDYLAASDGFQCHGLHTELVARLPVAFLAFVLPTAAGAMDATRD